MSRGSGSFGSSTRSSSGSFGGGGSRGGGSFGGNELKVKNDYEKDICNSCNDGGWNATGSTGNL